MSLIQTTERDTDELNHTTPKRGDLKGLIVSINEEAWDTEVT